MKKIFNYLFNMNTGYFLETFSFTEKGKSYKGIFVCRGYRFFGVPGYDRIAQCKDIDGVNEYLKCYGVKFDKNKFKLT